MHTYSNDLAAELERKGKRRSLTSTKTIALGEETKVGVTRARRTIAITNNRKRRQTTNHLEDSSEMSREDWIAKLLGKPVAAPAEDTAPDAGAPNQGKKRKNKKKKKKKNKARPRPNDFDDAPRKKRGRATVFVDPAAKGGDDEPMPEAPGLQKQLSLVLTPPTGGSQLIAGMQPDGLGDEMVVDHTPSKKASRPGIGSRMSARFQTKKSRAELEKELSTIHKVTSVKLRGNKKRHITVKDGRLWWLKNETMAQNVVNGDLSNASPKHSIDLSLVKNIQSGVAGSSVFAMVQDTLDADVCVSVESGDRDLNIMMESGKLVRDKWVNNLRQLVKLIQKDGPEANPGMSESALLNDWK